jgi:CDP-paratose 2-epimerase
MRVLVTGNCGFVGSTLVRGLVASVPGIEVWGIDNFMREGSRGNVEPLKRHGVRQIEGDIRFPKDLGQVGDVDWVIDCAANPSVLAGVDGSSSSFDLMDHNLVGTIRMLEFCRERRAGFILMSTSRVYSIAPLAALPVKSVDGAYVPQSWRPEIGLGERGISERFPADPPASLYGMSKRCSELLALEYADAFGFPAWLNRCGVLAGAGQFGKADQGIFSFWIRSWARRQPLKYIGFDGKGSQVRDCLHPKDLVELVLRQMRGESPKDPGDGIDRRICNFSGGTANAMSLGQLSRWCKGRLGQHTVASDPNPRPFDLPWVVLDSSRAEHMWNWRPVTSLPDVLEEIAGTVDSTPG